MEEYEACKYHSGLWKPNNDKTILLTQFSTNADIDQLPAKLIKMLEETSGQPPSEEELREIYDAHSELKRNVQLLKEEMNDKVEKMRILSERMNTEKDAKPLDLVTELMDSCGIPCDEGKTTICLFERGFVEINFQK